MDAVGSNVYDVFDVGVMGKSCHVADITCYRTRDVTAQQLIIDRMGERITCLDSEIHIVIPFIPSVSMPAACPHDIFGFIQITLDKDGSCGRSKVFDRKRDTGGCRF